MNHELNQYLDDLITEIDASKQQIIEAVKEHLQKVYDRATYLRLTPNLSKGE